MQQQLAITSDGQQGQSVLPVEEKQVTSCRSGSQKRSRDRRSLAENTIAKTLSAKGAAVRRNEGKSSGGLVQQVCCTRVYERGKEVFGRQEIRSGVKKSSGVRVEVQQR